MLIDRIKGAWRVLTTGRWLLNEFGLMPDEARLLASRLVEAAMDDAEQADSGQ